MEKVTIINITEGYMHQKKKILFIIAGLVGGGAENALVNLLNALDKNNYEIDLLVIFADKMVAEKLCDVNIYVLFPSNKNFFYKLAKHLYSDFKLKGLLRMIARYRINKSYDTIISYVEGNSLLYHSFLYDRTKNNVSWVHTDFVENHWSKRHFINDDEYHAYLGLNKLVFVSDYAKTQFSKVFSMPERIHQYVCANVINTDEILAKSNEPIHISKNKFTICSVGRLEKVKGYDMVIEAAKILKERGIDVDFWILGVGSQEKQLKEQLKQVSCEDMVHFLGYQSNPYPYMRAADVYLSSSYAEGLPLVLCEARCLGKPIIATKTIGALELLKNYKNCKLVDMSTMEIVNAIEEYSQSQWCLDATEDILKEYNACDILDLLYSDIL